MIINSYFSLCVFVFRYDCQSSIVDHVFPPLGADAETPGTHQEFSSFAFWREPIPDVTLEENAASKEEEEAPKTEEVAAVQAPDSQEEEVEETSTKTNAASQDPNSPEE